MDDESVTGRAAVHEASEAGVLMLSTIVPHACHALWSVLGHAKPIIDMAWPKVDEQALVRDVIEIVVQVNGKLRGRISVPIDADNDAVSAQALADPNVQRFVGKNEVLRTIVVPGRLVNIVV